LQALSQNVNSSFPTWQGERLVSDKGTRAQYCFPAVALELQQQQFALVGRCQTLSAVASGL